MQVKTWLPTRKWFASQVATAAGLGIAAVQAGGWNDTLSITAIGWAAAAITAYLVPNQDTPGGVPTKTT